MSDVTPTHNPDVLDCLANLSNDEVFTPPRVANAMLDLLPQSLFADPEATFLDPCCKSGVFLREIAKRLLVGLEPTFPDLQARLDHILRRQLFGLAITELTALTSRRTLYCSKVADGKYSLSHFPTPEGNILFPETRHEWVNGRCRLCGVSQDTLKDRKETHAYAFIHGINPERLFKMKFDVIIGNPPYQLNVGVEKENYAVPIYQKFIEQAKRLGPAYIVMIVPARWYAGGRGLEDFRTEMLNDRHLTVLTDYPNATDCFAGVDIAGGVCYFLWERDKQQDCVIHSIRGKKHSILQRPLLEQHLTTFVRFNEAIPIIRKILSHHEASFSNLVSPQTPFGLYSSFRDYLREPFEGAVKIHTVAGVGYIRPGIITKGQDLIAKYKVYIAKSYGERGDYPYQFLARPFLGEPNSCCTQTYLCIGPLESKREAENIMAYIRTRFFRFCIMLRKNTQDAMRGVYSTVPLQDFSGEPWTDEVLYAKYGLSAEEIAFIEAMVKPMEV